MKGGRFTLALAGLTVLVLLLSVPGSLREAFDRGGLYLFSWAFFEDIPRRLTGPGRFRFLMQPAIAILLGIRDGRADARAGRPPYLWALVAHGDQRRALMRSGLGAVVNVVLMGILLDAIFQWVILGVSYPGAALVVGPILVATPYAITRALANRASRRWMGPASNPGQL